MILYALISHQTPNPTSCTGNTRIAQGPLECQCLLLSAGSVLYFCLEPNFSKLFRNLLRILLLNSTVTRDFLFTKSPAFFSP
jgi:hypothetical protein